MEKVHNKLMIPGPVEVHPDVLNALGQPVEPHYGPEWVKKYARATELLQYVFNTKNDVLLLVGSGTCALDACMGSSLMNGEKIIIANNGFFGDRLVSIAEHNGLELVEVKGKWGEKIDPADVRKALDDNLDVKAVAVVHSETSTTVLNPVAEIGQIVKGTDAVYMVDAVSSLGGIPYDVDEWGIDLCASASQKCLGSVPGLAPVSVSRKGWDCIDRSMDKAHGWFTNLQIWRKYAEEWSDWHPTPVTVSVNIVDALLVALEMLIEEGIENRMQRYTALAMCLRNGLRDAGMTPFTPDEELNPVLTAAYSPEGVNSGKIVEYLLNEHHIQISTGLGELKTSIFRVGHMSPVLEKEDIDTLVKALKSF
jgi:alanine-glyoxylate transaminase/serine-glyoxylate transaminase/serine-pyruvate transaminase